QLEITIPPAVLENHDVLAQFSSEVKYLFGFFATGCERLLYQNVFSGIQCLYRIVYVRIVWGVDDNELDSIVIQQVTYRVVTDDIGVPLLRPFLVPLNDGT